MRSAVEQACKHCTRLTPGTGTCLHCARNSFSFLHNTYAPEIIFSQKRFEGKGKETGVVSTARDSLHCTNTLHAAAAYGCVRLLLPWLALAGTVEALGTRDARGWTPLHHAVAQGHTDCVRVSFPGHAIDQNKTR